MDKFDFSRKVFNVFDSFLMFFLRCYLQSFSYISFDSNFHSRSNVIADIQKWDWLSFVQMTVSTDGGILENSLLSKSAEIFRICMSIEAVPNHLWNAIGFNSIVNESGKEIALKGTDTSQLIDICPLVKEFSLDSFDVLLYSFCLHLTFGKRSTLIQSIHVTLVSILNEIKQCEVRVIFFILDL